MLWYLSLRLLPKTHLQQHHGNLTVIFYMVFTGAFIRNTDDIPATSRQRCFADLQNRSDRNLEANRHNLAKQTLHSSMLSDYSTPGTQPDF